MNKVYSHIAIATAILLGGTTAGQAADGTEGFGPGSILLRTRALGVLPQTGTTLSGAGASVVGGSAGITDNWVPEVDGTYFFTQNIAVEAIAAVTYHDVRVKNNNLGSLGLNPLSLGSTRLLPPTVTAQWHFLTSGAFKPYVGAGVNYTFFYDQHGGPSNVIQSTHYNDALGAALQIGTDYQIANRWYLNVDAKKLFVGTDVHLGTVVGPIKARVDIDPWLLGFGVGYRF